MTLLTGKQEPRSSKWDALLSEIATVLNSSGTMSKQGPKPLIQNLAPASTPFSTEVHELKINRIE